MGCGVVADYGHLPAIVKTPGLELVSLFDPSKERVEATAQKFGVPKTFTEQDAFLDSGLEAVVVASPVGAHLGNVRAAAERGLHVLCEKPLGMDDEEVEEMIRLTDAAGTMLFTGFVYRFSHVSTQIKRWVEEGIVGEIRSSRLVYLWELHGQYEFTEEGKWVEAARYRGRMLEGGPMVDCGVHQIDLARWWLQDEVRGVDVAAAWVADYDAPDHVWLHMDHTRGAHTMVEMSFSYGHTAKEPAPLFTYELIGTGGVLRYDRNGWLLEARHGQGTLRVPGASEKNFAGMHEAFAEALRTGDGSRMPSARDGMVATRIARDATDEVMARRRLAMATR